jgi:sugar lactone lactonase YvrE
MGDPRIIEAAGRCRLGEGPFWSSRENALYWVDILGQAVHRLRLADQSVTSWPMPEKIGWIIERANGLGFVAGFQSGFVLLTLDPLQVQHISRPEAHLPNNRMNDAKADASGRIWAGTMDVDADKPSGAYYRLDSDHSVTLVDSGYLIPNGPAFSPDHRYLYHTDSGRRLVYRFEITPEGRLADRSIFLAFGAHGTPDGMTVDQEGGLWVAVWGGSRVSRFTPDGRHDRSIALPASQITNCAFAGHDLDRMFVTSASDGVPQEHWAGCLFEIDPGVRGLAPGRFGG